MDTEDKIIDARYLISEIYQDVMTGSYELTENDKEDLQRSIETLKNILN